VLGSDGIICKYLPYEFVPSYGIEVNLALLYSSLLYPC